MQMLMISKLVQTQALLILFAKGTVLT